MDIRKNWYPPKIGFHPPKPKPLQVHKSDKPHCHFSYNLDAASFLLAKFHTKVKFKTKNSELKCFWNFQSPEPYI
jgi:hypothetical protein